MIFLHLLEDLCPGHILKRRIRMSDKTTLIRGKLSKSRETMQEGSYIALIFCYIGIGSEHLPGLLILIFCPRQPGGPPKQQNTHEEQHNEIKRKFEQRYSTSIILLACFLGVQTHV